MNIDQFLAGNLVYAGFYCRYLNLPGNFMRLGKLKFLIWDEQEIEKQL